MISNFDLFRDKDSCGITWNRGFAVLPNAYVCSLPFPGSTCEKSHISENTLRSGVSGFLRELLSLSSSESSPVAYFRITTENRPSK
jgi:hypothetical protein